MPKYCMLEKIRQGKDGCPNWRWGECVKEGECANSGTMPAHLYKRLRERKRWNV